MAKTRPDPVRLVSVAVPVPFLDVLTYQVPDGLATPPRGARVVVPLGKRVVTGIVVDPAATLDGQTTADKIKDYWSDTYWPQHRSQVIARIVKAMKLKKAAIKREGPAGGEK